MPKLVKCKDCPKELTALQRFMCPACGDIRCLVCFGKHLEAKVCKYGKAEVIEP